MRASMPAGKTKLVIPQERIDHAIQKIRGQRVILDTNLAEMYGITTGQLVRQVKRYPSRFPADFAFELCSQELANLKCHPGISSSQGGRRTPHWAFTEHGVAMLSSIFDSDRAIEVTIAIMRAFVRLRERLATDEHLARRLDKLQKKFDNQLESTIKVMRVLTLWRLICGRIY